MMRLDLVIIISLLHAGLSVAQSKRAKTTQDIKEEIITLGANDRIVYDQVVDEEREQVVVSLGNSIEVWQYTNAVLLKSWSGQKVISLAMNEEKIAGGTKDGHVLIWQRDGTLITEINLSGSPVTQLKFAINGDVLAATDAGELLKLSVDAEKAMASLKIGVAITAIAISHDNKSILIGDAKGVIRTIDLEQMREIASHKVHKSWVRDISVDDDYLTSVGDDGKLTESSESLATVSKRGHSFAWLLCVDSYKTTRNAQRVVATGASDGECVISFPGGAYHSALDVMINRIHLLEKRSPRMWFIAATHGRGIMIIPASTMKLRDATSTLFR